MSKIRQFMRAALGALFRPAAVAFAAPGNLIVPVMTATYNLTTTYLNRDLPCTPGTVVWSADRSRAYRLCQMDDAVAITTGMVVCFSTAGVTDRYSVTPDRAGGTSVNAQPAGVALNTANVAADEYFWVQCYGLGEKAIVTDGSVAQSEHLIAHATTDGGTDTAAGTEATGAVLGTALVADTGTALAAGEYTLTCPTDSVDAIS